MTRTFCDICHEPIAVGGVRLRVIGEPHPLDSKVVEETIDICRACLPHVRDLRSDQTADAIRRARIAARGES